MESMKTITMLSLFFLALVARSENYPVMQNNGTVTVPTGALTTPVLEVGRFTSAGTNAVVAAVAAAIEASVLTDTNIVSALASENVTVTQLNAATLRAYGNDQAVTIDQWGVVASGPITLSAGGTGAVSIQPGTGSHVWIQTGWLDVPFVLANSYRMTQQAADPDDPAEGKSVIWMSDGTGAGDAGDIMVKITSGATTKTTTLIDFSTLP